MDQLVSCLRKVSTFPPRFKLYWIVYFGVLRDFMSALIKHGLFPEASTSSQAAIDLAGALNNPKQKSLFLSKQRSELMIQARKYSRLFSNCSSDLIALVSVAYCVSISKQLGKLQEEAASEMFSNQYFGGYKRLPGSLLVINNESTEQIKDTSELHLKDEFQFLAFLDHFAMQLVGGTQSSAISSSLLVNATVAVEEEKEDNILISSKATTKSCRKRKPSHEGESDRE